jgi:hypothetical protein
LGPMLPGCGRTYEARGRSRDHRPVDRDGWTCVGRGTLFLASGGGPHRSRPRGCLPPSRRRLVQLSPLRRNCRGRSATLGLRRLTDRRGWPAAGQPYPDSPEIVPRWNTEYGLKNGDSPFCLRYSVFSILDSSPARMFRPLFDPPRPNAADRASKSLTALGERIWLRPRLPSNPPCMRLDGRESGTLSRLPLAARPWVPWKAAYVPRAGARSAANRARWLQRRAAAPTCLPRAGAQVGS